MDVPKDVEWYVPSSSYSLSHSWSSPPFPKWTEQGIAWVTYLLSCPDCICVSVALSPGLSVELALPCSLAPSLGVNLVLSPPYPGLSWAWVLVLLCSLSPPAGQWGAPWSWTPTASAARRSGWRGSRQSCASWSQRLCRRWPRAPSWASGSASTNSASAAGTAPATASTSARSCSRVRPVLPQLPISQKDPSLVTHLPGTPGAESWREKLFVCACRGLLSAPRCSHAEVLLPRHVSLCCNEAITNAPRQCGAS